jgi:DNA ligase-1
MTPYRLLAESLERVASSRGRLAKVAILADALRALESEELAVGARLLSGSPFAEWEQSVTSVGWATVVKTAVAVTGWDPDTIRSCASAIGDLGEAVSLLMPRRTENGLTVAEVDALFRSIAAASKPAGRGALLEDALRRSSAVEAKYLLKTLSGGLRIGADVTTVEEAIASAFSTDREAVARARRDSGDVGETAAAARAGTLDAIAFRLFHPIGFMLASPIEEAEEIVPELPLFAVEDKFDGIRAHAHKDGGRVALFSRTLDEVTAQFPEIAEALGRSEGTWLLDGEIVAWRGGERQGDGDGEGRPDSFFKLQRRLGRKSPEPELLAEIPARFVAYDCLAAAGRPLFEAPWNERRAALEEIASAAGISLSEVASAATAAELEALFVRARERGNEGLVLKRRDSTYQAGKRGRAWRKWKKALATLDVVVTAVEQGHGKRAGMLSDYTFAVRDGDRFVNIGKAYSGLTDEEIKRLGTRFRRETLERWGPVRAVQPTLVIEVAFDTIQKSARHKSGFALRFPRIVRLREDKPVSEITTLDEVRELFERVSGEGGSA